MRGRIEHKEWMEADPTAYALLKENARRQRLNPTDAESVLWGELRGNMPGVKFRRQHIIGSYIVDFVSIARHLVIEVDGPYHATPEQREADALRSRFLQQAGYDVMRFTNEQVLFNTEEVVRTIDRYLRTP